MLVPAAVHLREFVARLPVADLAEFRIVEFFVAVRTPSRILRRRATVWAVVLASQPHHADAAMHPWHNWRLGEGHSGGFSPRDRVRGWLGPRQLPPLP